MTTQDLSRQWTQIQSKLTEVVRPPALRAALSNPWVIGLGAACAAFGIGYSLGRRGQRPEGPNTRLSAPLKAEVSGPPAGRCTTGADARSDGEPPPASADGPDGSPIEAPAKKTPRASVIDPLSQRALIAGIDALQARLTEAAARAHSKS